jgi:sulfane dehydrogenase subunit SoxC
MRNNRSSAPSERDAVAGNGLLDRHLLLSAGTAAAALGGALPSKAGELPIEPWMKLPGSGFVGYAQPSKFESKVARTFASLAAHIGLDVPPSWLAIADEVIE